MDSLTQAVLGAAIGEVTLGKKLGWKAVLWGAFFGTLPDLDVLVSPFLDEAARLRWHRGISHSILVMILAPLLLAKPLAFLHREREVTFKNAAWMIFWVWSTHVIIDVFTTYGTQIYEPFSDARASTNTFFIIDPLFTLPLLIGIIAVLFFPKESGRRRKTIYSAVGISTLYVLFSFMMKFWALGQVKVQAAQDIPGGKVIAVSATPMNTILWRGLIESEQGYFVTYWSPFDEGPAHYDFTAKNPGLITPFNGEELMESLKWFSRGAWAAKKSPDGTISFIDMRFGEIRDQKSGTLRHIFQWGLNKKTDGTFQAVMNRPKELNIKPALSLIWKRMWGQRREWEDF